MTDKYNTRIEAFRMPDGRIYERRTEIKSDGSLGEVHGSPDVATWSDGELAAAGAVKLSEAERLEIEATETQSEQDAA